MTKQSEVTIDLDRFPEIKPEHRPRVIYIRGFTLLDCEAVKLRGYDPIDIQTLPRRDEKENELYLVAKLQAVEEGTIAYSREERLALVVALQTYGLMKEPPSVNDESTDKSVEQLFDWKKSRHTLRDNSTVVGVGENVADSKASIANSKEAALEQARLRSRTKLKSAETKKKLIDKLPKKRSQ